jgi:hypothetical protein
MLHLDLIPLLSTVVKPLPNVNVGCSSEIDPGNPDARHLASPPTSAGAMLLPSAYIQSHGADMTPPFHRQLPLPRIPLLLLWTNRQAHAPLITMHW